MRILRRPIVLLLILSIFASCGSVAVSAAEEPVVASVDSEDILFVELLENPEESEVEAELLPEATVLPQPEEPAEPAVTPEPVVSEEEPVPTATPEPVTTTTPIEETLIPDELKENVVDTSNDWEEASAQINETASYNWAVPGNTDSEILTGGQLLNAPYGLYYTDTCIWLKTDANVICISDREGKNLNLTGEWLYYTDDNVVYRASAYGGSEETVHTAENEIDQLYVIGGELRFLAGGSVYSLDMSGGELSEISSPANVKGIIPTAYGNLFLTGSARDYTLWAEETALRSGIRNCYSVGEWLVIEIGADVWQTPIENLFTGDCTLYDFELFAEVAADAVNTGLTVEQQLANEAAYLETEAYSEHLHDAPMLLALEDYLYYKSSNPDIAYTAGNLTQNQENIILRARQMAEVEWTPLKDRYSWGGNDSSYVGTNRFGSRVTSINDVTTYGYFKAGETYRGVPYSQAVNTGYVGWNISISNFVKAVNDTSSKFYSGYSTFSRTAPYYGSDCSGFVSWAWDLPVRCTCTSLADYYSQYIGTNINSIQVGDCLNNTDAHVVLVTDIGYDDDGNIVAIEITEQTPSKMRVSCYGEQIPGKYYDALYSMSYFRQYYFNGGYVIYRRDCSKDVTFTESEAVDLNKNGYARAPRISIAVNAAGSAKIITLSHSDSEAVIYYTTNGDTPTSSSTKYTGPFQVTKDTTIKAIAECGTKYTGSYVLTYKVVASKSAAPMVSLLDGGMYPDSSITYVSSGTKILLFNEAGDTIYYTTNGATPTTSSTKMTSAGVTITKNTILKAIAVGESTLSSTVSTFDIRLGQFHEITTDSAVGGIISPSGTIEVLDGKSYTFSIVPDAYYAIKDVKVDGTSVGAVKSYTFTSVTEDHTIGATFSVDLPFKDVGDAWYTDNILFAYSKGLVSGTSSTTFSPYDCVTRAMFITILGRYAKAGTDLESWSGRLGITNGSGIAIRESTTTSDTCYVRARTSDAGEHLQVLGRVSAANSVDGAVWYEVKYKGVQGYMRQTATGTNPKTLLYVYNGLFSDLENGAYYNGYVQWGSAMGLVKGLDDYTYAPHSHITRQDICVLIHRYLTEYEGKTLSTSSTKFTDDGDISSYAKTAVYAMKKIGVVNGYDDGSFNPLGYATRAEIATIFTNLYKWMNG